MKTRITINSSTYLRLLFLVPAHLLVGFTGCSGVHAGPQNDPTPGNRKIN